MQAPEGMARCVVLYRISSLTTEYTDTSEDYGRAGDILPIVLSIPFETDTVLTVKVYTVGGQQDATVEGSFNIGMFSSVRFL